MKTVLIVLALAPMTVMLLVAMFQLLTASEQPRRPAYTAEPPTDSSPAADKVDRR